MSESTVTVAAVITAAPGHGDQVIANFAQVIPLVHAETGCLRYAAHREQDTGDVIVMFEQWASRADLDAHAAGDAIVQLNALNAGLLAGPSAVFRLDPVPAGDPVKGSVPFPS